MQTIDEAREHCRYVAQGIADVVVREFFEALYHF